MRTLKSHALSALTQSAFLLLLLAASPMSWAAPSVDVSRDHNCLIEADGDLFCWGANDRGQLGDGTRIDRTTPVQIGPAGVWDSVSVGESHTCAIRSNETLWCWGDNRQFQLGLGTSANQTILVPTQVGTDDWLQISAGRYHTCGIQDVLLDDGEVWCWGQNTFGQVGDGTFVAQALPVQVGTEDNWVAIAAGDRHTCAYNDEDDQSLFCWGDNTRGQLGTGNRTMVGEPTQGPDGIAPWVALAAGADHTCAILDDDQLLRQMFCWGANDAGQLGVGTQADSLNALPVLPINLVDWLAVFPGDRHTCAINEEDALFCWGENVRGEVDNYFNNPALSPQAVDTINPNTWTLAAAGGQNTCAIDTSSAVWCWGDRLHGQIGDAVGKFAPGVSGVFFFGLTFAEGPRMVAAGGNSVCAIRPDGEMYCFGRGLSGQIGDNALRDRPVPTLVVKQDANLDWVEVAGGNRQFCARQTTPELSGLEHTLWCWGASESRRLGVYSGADRPAPARLDPPSGLPDPLVLQTDWLSVSLGTRHGCGVAKFGPDLNETIYQRMLCWGDGSYGQVGNGSIPGTASISITQAGTDADGLWRQVSSGANHNCATKEDGTLWCWGDNTWFQLAQPAAPFAISPTQVGTDDNWLSAHAGGATSCGIRTDGTLWCWGDNRGGQLGIGSVDRQFVPQQVGTQTDWQALAVGKNHICGVRSINGGTLFCWGNNGQSQVFGTASAHVATPTQVGPFNGWTNVAAGDDVSCTVFGPTDVLWCLGDNFYGQVGDDRAWVQHPVAVTFPGP